ncbi:MAG: bi-domain-containing oxidoreductase [candidate division KSB1 bacterium]|nr:bi-domain-containing oxidoreductase [candidate division KSB1 bacterium]MDZ7276091.1 bi-domain-containing oxidoreductase [candidate division KSB1 bacterium]MDZ7287129.1 bi-domain-containing oxidoreductase [candidate division KSB1 bacterium]MDZ7296946.1 bi-domain-containing oxidoreductase [candidate division KSB1 bacterium]MDZ7307163.1 bi-domain-containing oxidoreductase [candidate division KSB1 bacterium]
MKQILQDFQTGKLQVAELPVPLVRPGMVLVRNRCSLISAGTERATVAVAQSSLLGKAQKRPDLVRQVLENVRREGVAATYAKVRSRLRTVKTLGYSCAGEVMESGCPELFQAGDRVACAGGEYAQHAEYVLVPKHLCVRLPDNVSDEEGAYSTLGAIALQGVRQAEPRLGEWVAVIGLGLLGQLAIQLLEANGCNVVGIDLSAENVARAQQTGVTACLRQTPHLEEMLRDLTAGHGFDACLITAATKSNDPLELSGRLVRKKGRIVIVGWVRVDLPRSPFYEKELEVRMSCSYGPGRYDQRYEAEGRDYPFAYVRWTEQRNLAAFVQLLAKGRVKVKELTTHRFPITRAVEAYQLILGRTQEKYLGVLLEYPAGNDGLVRQLVNEQAPAARRRPAARRIGFIGAGNFAQAYLLPPLQRQPEVQLAGVANAHGPSAKSVCEKFGFSYCTTDYRDLLADDSIDSVFIATRHDAHASLAMAALQAGKNVFVEKPPALTLAELRELHRVYIAARTQSGEGPRLVVGYNRRHAPLAREIKRRFAGAAAPLVVHYRVNAGFLDGGHWLHDPHSGGGRIIGEACHFVDLAMYFIEAAPVSVYAEGFGSSHGEAMPFDNVVATLRFQNGGLATISYLANGSARMPKEHVEIFGGGLCARLDNFTGGVFYSATAQEKLKMPGKGYAEEIAAFLRGEPAPTVQELFYPSLITFAIMESLRTRQPRVITWSVLI